MTGFGRNVLNLSSGTNGRIAVLSASSTNLALPGPTGGLYLLSANLDTYVKWGSGSQTASNSSFDLFMPAGLVIVVQLASGTNNIAARGDSADGSLAVQAVNNL